MTSPFRAVHYFAPRWSCRACQGRGTRPGVDPATVEHQADLCNCVLEQMAGTIGDSDFVLDEYNDAPWPHALSESTAP